MERARGTAGAGSPVAAGGVQRWPVSHRAWVLDVRVLDQARGAQVVAAGEGCSRPAAHLGRLQVVWKDEGMSCQLKTLEGVRRTPYASAARGQSQCPGWPRGPGSDALLE